MPSRAIRQALARAGMGDSPAADVVAPIAAQGAQIERGASGRFRDFIELSRNDPAVMPDPPVPMDVITLKGANAALVAVNSSADVFIDATNPLYVVYTPTINVWVKWEVHIGYMVCDTVGNLYHRVKMSPADANGVTVGPWQRRSWTLNEIGNYRSGQVYKLTAGTTYTFKADWSVASGTYRYYQDTGYLQGTLEVWPR